MVKVDRVSNYNDTQLHNMLENLSDSRRSKVAGYSGEHFKQSLVASFGLEEKLCMLCGYKKADLEYTYMPSGKPMLNGNYYISISHSKDYICYGLSKQAIGVDIEHIRGIKSERLVSSRFFNDREKAWVDNSPINFLYLWTFKEAVCKCLDKPLLEVLDEIEYPVINLYNWAELDIKTKLAILGKGFDSEFVFDEKKYFFRQYIKEESIVAVCESEI